MVLPCLSEVVTGPAEADAPPAEGAAAIACRVLVVDDNRDAASTTAMCLEIAGHQVRTVHDGLQALALAPTFLPDVVVLDLSLIHI